MFFLGCGLLRAAGANLQLRARLSDRLGRHCQIIVAILSEDRQEAATCGCQNIGSLIRLRRAYSWISPPTRTPTVTRSGFKRIAPRGPTGDRAGPSAAA